MMTFQRKCPGNLFQIIPRLHLSLGDDSRFLGHLVLETGSEIADLGLLLVELE